MRCVRMRIRSDMTFRSDVECPNAIYIYVSFEYQRRFFLRIERIQTTLPRVGKDICREGYLRMPGPRRVVTRNILDGRRENTANSRRT